MSVCWTGAPDVHFPLLWPLSLTCSGVMGGDGGQMADAETSVHAGGGRGDREGAVCILLASDVGKRLTWQQPM